MIVPPVAGASACIAGPDMLMVAMVNAGVEWPSRPDTHPQRRARFEQQVAWAWGPPTAALQVLQA